MMFCIQYNKYKFIIVIAGIISENLTKEQSLKYIKTIQTI